MKKLVAVVLTGVLVAGTLSTGVYAKDDDKTITVAASATPHAERTCGWITSFLRSQAKE